MRVNLCLEGFESGSGFGPIGGILQLFSALDDGTLLAQHSLASLITLGEYRRRAPGKTLRYLALFSLINFSFLAVLIGTGYLNALLLG